MKVLMIDDQPGLTKVVGRVAAQLGMEYRGLNKSVDAAAVFSDYRPDIVILDMIMPDKDGIAVLNEILSTGIPARLVMTTGYSDSLLRLAQGIADSHGCTEAIQVLKKPFYYNEVMDLLKHLGEATEAEKLEQRGCWA